MPARLKALLGEMQVTEWRRASSEREANGMAGIRQFAMNLVSHHQHAVSPADIRDLLQFRPRPDAPGGIVGIAQEQELDGGIRRLPLQVLRIKRVPPVLVLQRAGFRHAPVKQLYTGVCTSTLSPGAVRARMMADSAGTTPVV